MLLRLTTLGQLALHDATTGERLAIQRKALVLLAVLAAEGRPIPRERLVSLLWPDDVSSARGALKQTVYQLRRALDAQDVVVGAAELELDGERITTDVEDLARAHAAGEWDRVAQLHGGLFLEGVWIRRHADFDHWVDARRTHYATLFHHALEQAALLAATRGDRRAAVVAWRRLAAADPLSGRAAHGLVAALAEAGEHAAALAHYAAHERLLRDELGAPPDPGLVRVAENLRVLAAGPRRPTPRADPVEAVPAAAPVLDGSGSEDGPMRRIDAVPARRTRGGRGRRLWVAAAAVALAGLAMLVAWKSRESPRVLASRELPADASVRLALDPVLNRVYVDAGASFTHVLSIVDGESLRLRTLPHGAGAIVDPITHWYWTGDYGGRFVVVRNGFTDSALARVALPGCPHAFAISNTWLWVAQQCDDHISVIDSRTRAVVRHIPIPTLSRAEVGGAKGMGELVVNPNTGMVYFWKDMMPHRLDPRTWTLRETPEFGGHVLAVNAASNVLYVRAYQGIRVVDGTAERAVAEVPLESPPWSVAVGFGGNRVYAATPSALVILDGRSHRVLRTVRFRDGYRPDGVAVDETRGRVYVAGMVPGRGRSLRILALDD